MQTIGMAIQHGNSSCILETPGSRMRLTACNSYFNLYVIDYSFMIIRVALLFTLTFTLTVNSQPLKNLKENTLEKSS